MAPPQVIQGEAGQLHGGWVDGTGTVVRDATSGVVNSLVMVTSQRTVYK